MRSQVNDLVLKGAHFLQDTYFTRPLDFSLDNVEHDDEDFDQSGYELMHLEEMFANVNNIPMTNHAIRRTWFTQPYKEEGCVLNHSYILERKGFDGGAKTQLEKWARLYPCYYRYLNIRPKWGLDFSLDFFDRTGRTFEVLHWEFDSFSKDEIEEQKSIVEQVFLNTDWDDFADIVWDQKDEWYNLTYEEQTAWRCKLLGIIPDRYKMCVW